MKGLIVLVWKPDESGDVFPAQYSTPSGRLETSCPGCKREYRFNLPERQALICCDGHFAIRDHEFEWFSGSVDKELVREFVRLEREGNLST